MNRIYHVYIVASGRNGTLYVGMTGNIGARGWQHHSGAIEGFTKRYGVRKLVYMEAYSDAKEAIAREKQIKAGNRAKKLALIENLNPSWKDLYGDLI